MTTKKDAPEAKEAESRFSALLAEMKQERDELQVKMKLGENELKDEWEHLEDKWRDLNRKAHAAGVKLHAAADAAKEAGASIDTAWDLLLDEIKAGYKNIREKL